MRLYHELAGWFHLLTAPHDYAEEAVVIASTLDSLARRDVRTVLELGAGGGNNASWLKHRYAMTLTDISAAMLELSRSINPECEHIEGDMRTLRLGRRFDAVLIHDAIMHLTTAEDVVAAIATAAEHLDLGGVVLIVPDATTETYRSRTESGGHDGDGRAMRYLMWNHEPEGNTHRTTMVYVLEDESGTRVEHEIWTIGLFPRATWLRLIEAAGLEARALPFPHSSFGGEEHEMFAGLEPGGGERGGA